MDIKETYPPNYITLQQFFPLHLKDYTPIFPYGDTIYNPFKVEIPADILFHEHIHIKQQKQFSSPELWWAKYIIDSEFRLSQELEAYARQCIFVKQNTNDKIFTECMEEAADHLASPVYKLNLTKSQAETKLRLYIKSNVV